MGLPFLLPPLSCKQRALVISGSAPTSPLIFYFSSEQTHHPPPNTHTPRQHSAQVELCSGVGTDTNGTLEGMRWLEKDKVLELNSPTWDRTDEERSNRGAKTSYLMVWRTENQGSGELRENSLWSNLHPWDWHVSPGELLETTRDTEAVKWAPDVCWQEAGTSTRQDPDPGQGWLQIPERTDSWTENQHVGRWVFRHQELRASVVRIRTEDRA